MSLQKAKCVNNYILIRLFKNDTIKMKSGVKFLMPSFLNNDSEHSPLRGEVIGVPDGLFFEQGNHLGLKWKTDMDLQIGDNVIVRRPALEMALSKDNGSYFVEGEDLFCYLKYDEAVLAIRNEEIIMLNGMLLAEPIEEELPKTRIERFEFIQAAKKASNCFGIVAHIGKPNQEYHITKNSKGEEIITVDKFPYVRMVDGEVKVDMVDLKVGDKIQFAKAGNIFIENSLHETLDKSYWRMPRTKVLAIL